MPKAVCSKHGQAFEVSQGCLYCTPIVTFNKSDKRVGGLLSTSGHKLFGLSGTELYYSLTPHKFPMLTLQNQGYELRVGQNENPVAAFLDAAVELYIPPSIGPGVDAYWATRDLLRYQFNQWTSLSQEWLSVGSLAYRHNLTFAGNRIEDDTYRNIVLALCLKIGIIP